MLQEYLVTVVFIDTVLLQQLRMEWCLQKVLYLICDH